MIDLSKYKIIDLSMCLQPRVKRLNGDVVPGKPMFGQARRLYIEEFIYSADKTLQEIVDLESHVGTHVEMGYHNYWEKYPEAHDAAHAPIEAFFGEAVVLHYDRKVAIRSDDFKAAGVKKGDIVLLGGPIGGAAEVEGGEAPYLTREATEWLVKTGVKQIGLQNVNTEEPGASADAREQNHGIICANNIPLIEGLENLEKVSKKRVFYIGLPWNVNYLDSSPIRAIVLEEM